MVPQLESVAALRMRRLIALADLVQVEADLRRAGYVPAEPTEPAPINADPLITFIGERMRRRPNSSVGWLELFDAYSAWPNAEPLSAPHFGVAMAYICRRAGIRTRRDGDRVFCVGVRLV